MTGQSRGAVEQGYALPLRMYIHGRARTKGSLRPVRYRDTGSPVMAEQVVGSKAWRGTVAETVVRTLGGTFTPAGAGRWWQPWEGPVAVGLVVFLPRPAGAPGWPLRMRDGDLDKYQRNIGDALTDTGVIADDAQIVHWDTWKRWAGLGQQPGVRVEVTVVEA